MHISLHTDSTPSVPVGCPQQASSPPLPEGGVAAPLCRPRHTQRDTAVVSNLHRGVAICVTLHYGLTATHHTSCVGCYAVGQ
jgi:hypothetical protein